MHALGKEGMFSFLSFFIWSNPSQTTQVHKPERFTLHKNALIERRTGNTKGIVKQSTEFQSKSFPLNWMADSCERYANNVHPGWNFLLTALDTDNFRLLFFIFELFLHTK